jgi:hypothetical protein
MTRTPICLALCLALAACDQDSSYLDGTADAPADSPTDTTADTTPDVPADSPLDVPVDTPAEAPADTPADEGPTSDIARFCTIACVQCFGGTTGWNHLPADQCESECAADFAECSPSDITAILACPGGDDCPAGAFGFATCVAPYTCILE